MGRAMPYKLKKMSLAEKYIKFLAEEEDIHTDVKPEYREDEHSKAAINRGKRGKVLHIKRIESGKTRPACCAENSSEQLRARVGFVYREDRVQRCEKYYQQNKADKPAHGVDNIVGKFRYLCPFYKCVAEYKNEQGYHNDRNKQEGIQSGIKPQLYKSSVFLGVIYAVEAVYYPR